MLIFIDRQHAGKPSKVDDRGASVDINQDGQISSDEQEAHWTGYLSLMLEKRLLDLGHHVIPISDGSYTERHIRVNDYSGRFDDIKMVYLAMHLNAGGGDYGAFFHHHLSTQGKELAAALASNLGRVITVKKQKVIAAKPDDWTKNAWHTIKNVGKPIAICCEPIFMDTHTDLLSPFGMSQIAIGMAQGLDSWSKR